MTPLTTLEEYEAALKAHDWNYAWADDGSIYARGQRERDLLMHARRQLDPHGEIWSRYDPYQIQLRKEATK